MSQKVISKYEVQRWAKRQALGCEKILPGPAWLLLSKICKPFWGLCMTLTSEAAFIALLLASINKGLLPSCSMYRATGNTCLKVPLEC